MNLLNGKNYLILIKKIILGLNEWIYCKNASKLRIKFKLFLKNLIKIVSSIEYNFDRVDLECSIENKLS